MNPLSTFVIPIYGIKPGEHWFDFICDETFFSHFEDSPIERGLIQVKLRVFKTIDFFQLEFWVEGAVEAVCDRCTADINLPTKGNWSIVLKYAEEEREEDEVYYILTSQHHFDTSKIIYDGIVISMPIIKVYDCEEDIPRPCNMKVLEILEKHQQNISPPDDENTVWDSIKKIDF